MTKKKASLKPTVQWDEKTMTEVAVKKGFKDFEADLLKGIQLRAKVKALKGEVEGLEDQAKALLEPAFTLLKTTRIGTNGLGVLSWRNGSSPARVDGVKVIENLVTAGVDPTVARKAVDDATTPGTPYKYFQLTNKG